MLRGDMYLPSGRKLHNISTDDLCRSIEESTGYHMDGSDKHLLTAEFITTLPNYKRRAELNVINAVA